MSDAYERERQNNSRLNELSAKVSALRGVTVDIYDNARAQDVIDNTVCCILFTPFPPPFSILAFHRNEQTLTSTRNSPIPSPACPPPSKDPQAA